MSRRITARPQPPPQEEGEDSYDRDARRIRNHELFRLNAIVRSGIVNVFIFQLVSLVMYSAYWLHEPERHHGYTARAIFGIGIFLQALYLVVTLMIWMVPTYTRATAAIMLFLAIVNALFDSYRITHTVAHTYAVFTIIIEASFLAIDAVYLGISFALVFGFSGDAWGHYEAEADAAVARWLSKPLSFIALVVPLEFSFLYYYILITLALPMTQISGWLFCFHFFSASTGAAWLAMTAPAPPKPVRDHPPAKRPHKSPTAISNVALRSLLRLACFLFILDAVELSFVGGHDIGVLIALRALLFTCSIAYVLLIGASGVELDVPPKNHQIFYCVQYVLVGFVLLEICLIAFYFCYAVTIKANPFMIQYVFHILTITAAVYTMGVPPLSVLKGAMWLGVAAMIMLVFDIIQFAVIRAAVLNTIPTEYVVQSFLLAIDVVYIVIWGVVYIGTEDEDLVLYARFLEDDKFYLSRAIEHVDPYTKAKKRKDVEYSAEKIYYVVTFLIRPVVVMEFSILLNYLLILIETSPPWYEWLFMIHWLTIIAGVLVLAMQIDEQLALQFLIIMAVICFINDLILTIILGSAPALMVLQVFFLIGDVLYIAFYCVINYGLHPDAWGALYDLHSLKARLTISNNLLLTQ